MIVERCIGARIVDDAELFQGKREWQMFDASVFVDIIRLGDSCAQADLALTGKEMRDKGTGQYDDKRKVQQHNGRSFV